jgi:hypothetical protein
VTKNKQERIARLLHTLLVRAERQRSRDCLANISDVDTGIDEKPAFYLDIGEDTFQVEVSRVLVDSEDGYRKLQHAMGGAQ